jgi:ribose transport system permease protein
MSTLTRNPSARPTKPSTSVIPALFHTTAFYIALVVILLFLIFGALTPNHAFLTVPNLVSIGVNSAGLMLLAVGVTFVIASGNIDLSVGAILVLASVVAARVVIAVSGTPDEVAAGIYPRESLGIALGAIAAVLVGAAMGLLNGLLVTRLRVNSFVITLGTLGLATGLANVITNGANIPYLPLGLQTEIGLRRLLGFPVPLLIALLFAIWGWIWLRRTTFGRHVLATGSSARSARRAGVKTNRVTIGVFLIAGVMAGVAGFLDLTKFGTTAITGHETDMLQALSAVIIGGTSLFGGRASMGGSIVATFIPITLLSGFVMLGIPPFYQYMAVGGILIVAVYIDGVRRGQLSEQEV